MNGVEALRGCVPRHGDDLSRTPLRDQHGSRHRRDTSIGKEVHAGTPWQSYARYR